MKKITLSILLLLSVFSSAVFADAVKVTAKVLDRGDDGRAISNKYVYPEVELESGESAALHVGKDFRHQVWDADLEDFKGIGEIYENTKIGFTLGLKVSAVDGTIAYSGLAESIVVAGTSSNGTSLHSTKASFFGTVESGNIVELEIIDSSGVSEIVALHFATVEE